MNCKVSNTRGTFSKSGDGSLGSDSEFLIVGVSSTISLRTRRLKKWLNAHVRV